MKFKLTIGFFIGLISIIVFIFTAASIAVLDYRVTSKLDGVLWTIPAKIYSRPLELAEGIHLNKDNLIKELEMLSYERVKNPVQPGEFKFSEDDLKIFLRGYLDQRSGIFNINFDDSEIKGITNQLGIAEDLIKLEPTVIGGMYPSHMEDRVLLNWPEVPPILVDTILAVEDQNFFNHYGISLKSISRAFLRNVQAGEVEQGGSTITQQLAKSLFFSSEQTIRRKVLEAIASLIIETRYSKEEILLAYINDVFLAQSGKRAIHGFGMGAQHFFGTSIQNLSTDQVALLVGMLKGPSFYNPRRNPNNATKRRNLVLRVLNNSNKISDSAFEMLRNKALGVSLPNYRTETRYPAFHDIVRLELQKNFNEKELRTKGLAVETNLDPVLQDSLENNLQKTKLQLIKKYGSRLEGLEGAAIVVDISSGEVKAVAGSTEPSSYGFNRSINAIRPIGSLVKPFIYLTALDQYSDYNLTTLLDDSKLSLMSGGKLWEPDNFDKKFHGEIPLHVALWQSYNIASARLGLDLGYEAVENMFLNLGITKDVPNYPSLFIGSFELSPYQAIQAYQTIASDGFYSPLRSIRQIKDTEGKIEFSYPYSIDQTIRPEPVALLKFAMQQTFERGTARGYSKKQIQLWNAGGKTGTSDDQRDSWFVGFAGELLVLVWLGFDDNRQTPLTGRTGAFQVWKNFINDIKPVKTTQSSLPRINYVWTDIGDGLRSGKKCKNSILIPFIEGTEPNKIPDVRRECSSKIESSRNTVMDKLKEVFEVGQG
ncbi:penicillin-binding protein 1B [SAR86 cluster bacterium]|jgi:penicillin-binding protein 1B|nr:penicillin-binding protein 1B [SAR86 cluster bacterium]URQ68314.1 penicillin-binding protein 1B [SAR86 cluster bacterium]